MKKKKRGRPPLGDNGLTVAQTMRFKPKTWKAIVKQAKKLKVDPPEVVRDYVQKGLDEDDK